MAMGGGSFISQNKVLPGTYINFVSVSRADATLSDRGIVTMPLELDWGMENKVFLVESGDFLKYSRQLFGYDYSHEKMKGLREVFRHGQKLYVYRLNGGGEKAKNTLATARYSGVRGNDLSIVVSKNEEKSTWFDVMTYLGLEKIDCQTVAKASDLVDNDFVVFQKNATLAVTAKTPLAGGSNHAVDKSAHQAYLEAIENYRYHAMGVVTEDSTILALYTTFARRMRDELGQKFQAVLYREDADYEGIVSVKNAVTDSQESAASLVYWVTGLLAGCAVNKSCTNMAYDGEFSVEADYRQSELEEAIGAGEFVLHNVNGTLRVLKDINTLVSFDADKNALFSANQTVRVMDQIANDIAVIFQNKYLGKIPNDAAGRISLWADIMKHHKELSDMRAIEAVEDDDVIVEAGNDKNSVVVTDSICIINTMEKLYMTITVK